MNSILKKGIFASAILAGVAFGARAEKCDTLACRLAQTPAAELKHKLNSLVKARKTAFGHHDDTAYGHNWTGVKFAAGTAGRSDVKEISDYYPGVMSWDLGGLELQDTVNLDGVPFSLILREARAQNARGGVNTFSWHLRNQVTGGDSWDVSDKQAVHKMRTDPEQLARYQETVRLVARYLKQMTDENGRPFGVIFRPWHEQTGSWFFWGGENSSPEDYKFLWTEMRRIFDEENVNNVVWAFSPDRVKSEEQYMLTYPGDQYVDILGTDVYQFAGEGGDATYRNDAKTSLGIVSSLARKHKKIPAFTETGLEGISDPKWYTGQLLPLLNENDIAYVVVWRNAEDNKKHYYTPFKGHPAVDDFKAFTEDDLIVMADKPMGITAKAKAKAKSAMRVHKAPDAKPRRK